MGWDDAAPTAGELSQAPASSWTDEAPTSDELAKVGAAPQESKLKHYARAGLETLPMAGMVIGGALGTPADAVSGPGGTLAGAGLGAAAGTALKNLGLNAMGEGPQGAADSALDIAKNSAEGMAGEGLGMAAGKALERASSPVTDAIGNWLKQKAEGAAVNATGATGAQASKFAPNAGRELLNRGIVSFGNNQAAIAKKAGAAVDAANGQIDSALGKLQNQGVTVDRNAIYNQILSKIKELKGDESQAGVVRGLNNYLGNILDASDASGTQVPIQKAEQIKRGFQKAAGNWMDPDAGQAGKTMYQAYRNGVEDAATAANPALAQQFKEGKATYGLLEPIEEAAERRAGVQAQKQSHIGIGDLFMGEVGEHALGPVGYTLPIARHIIGPRLASSAAVGMDAAGNAVSALPKAIAPAAAVGTVNELPGASASGIQALIKAAQENPNMLNGIKNDDLRGKIQKAAESNNAPDEQMSQAAADMLKRPIDDETARQHYLNGN